MSLKKDMQTDLNVFYDTEEFACLAFYGEVEFRAIFINNFEIQGLLGKAISILASEDPGIKEDDIITIDGESFEVNNVDFKDDTKLEKVIGLTDDRN
ncbi:MAG: hypothetical protein WA916_08955 [Arcobacter sp.]|uniref:hypothetical protein n=1 Tax=Arcobacter sp. TaxID=1872629 RepID=UPI003C719024